MFTSSVFSKITPYFLNNASVAALFGKVAIPVPAYDLLFGNVFCLGLNIDKMGKLLDGTFWVLIN